MHPHGAACRNKSAFDQVQCILIGTEAIKLGVEKAEQKALTVSLSNVDSCKANSSLALVFWRLLKQTNVIEKKKEVF